MIQIRQARYEDIPKIMKFIDEHWKKGHIMGNDRVMFEFQHVRDKEVFYLIAEDDTDGTIYGAMGYIPMMEQEWPCISTVMIQCLKNPENRMLGSEISSYFEKHIPCYNIFSVGIEKEYAQLISSLDGIIKKLKHYYRLGKKREFKIAHINHYERPHIEESDAVFVPFRTMQDFKQQIDLDEIYKDYPRRSPNYIEHRYYNHPYYTYIIWGLHRKNNIKSAIVAREERVEDAKVLRIVDFFGRDKDIAYAGKEFDRILDKNNYEYIDFYCYGIDDDFLTQAGFIRRDENDSNIIPNYFDPFVKKNIELYFYTWYLPNIHVYRGFGDQDRPNHMINKNQKGDFKNE